MKKEIQSILQELYGSDKNLIEKEEELIKIINSMIDLKPNVKIDENFKEELRQKIAKEISIKKMRNIQEKWNKASLFQILSYVFWTAWVAAFWFFILKDTLFQDIDLGKGKQDIKFESTVIESDEWFWELSDVGNQNNAKWGWLAMENQVDAPVVAPTRDETRVVNEKKTMNIITENESMSEDESKNNLDADTSVIDAATNWDISVSNSDWSTSSVSNSGLRWTSPGSSMWFAWVDSIEPAPAWINPSVRISDAPMWKMIAPDIDYVPEIYRYSFSWNLNIDLKDMMPVYKRDNKKIDSKVFAESISKLDFAWVNLSNFSNVWISNISLTEDKEYGYNINVDFENSSMSIYKNWTKWPQGTYVEGEKQVFLEEKEIIKISEDFLAAHKIDLSKYGTPVVEKAYIMAYAKFSSSRIMPDYAQNITNVVYPLIVDWNEIVEEGWQAAWVRVEIDLKEKKVSWINWLSIDNYLKSDYKTETSTENILKVANVWWRYGFYDAWTEKVKYVDVNLKNPEIKYVHTYSFKDNTQEQFLIPAVVFEVDKPENTEYYYGETVIVPLLKDSYKYDEKGKIIGASE